MPHYIVQIYELKNIVGPVYADGEESAIRTARDMNAPLVELELAGRMRLHFEAMLTEVRCEECGATGAYDVEIMGWPYTLCLNCQPKVEDELIEEIGGRV